MTLAGRWTGIVAGGFVVTILMAAGCQEQQAQAPAAKPEPVRSVPASTEEGKKEGTKETQKQAVPTFFPSDVPTVSTSGVTTNETAPEIKQERVEANRPASAGPAVELALKFVPGQTATYRIITERYKSVEWKGSPAAKPAQFTDGRTGNHIELTFEQKVVQVQDNGNAVLEITIKGLKYVGEVVNKVVLSFDSSKPEDAESPLAALVGKSYQVKMSPKGQVVEIANVEPARQAMLGGLPGQNVALRLLSDNEIRDRHEIVALSALKDSQVRPGQTWSSIRTFSFDDLGAKSYERVYTLRRVGSGQLSVPSSELSAANRQLPTGNSDGRLAVVEMKAIPSAALAEELHKSERANPLARMSDNADSYQGRFVLDLDRGQVREYGEQMRNEWIIADPTSVPGQLAALRMAAWRFQRLELVQ